MSTPKDNVWFLIFDGDEKTYKPLNVILNLNPLTNTNPFASDKASDLIKTAKAL